MTEQQHKATPGAKENGKGGEGESGFGDQEVRGGDRGEKEGTKVKQHQVSGILNSDGLSLMFYALPHHVATRVGFFHSQKISSQNPFSKV